MESIPKASVTAYLDCMLFLRVASVARKGFLALNKRLNWGARHITSPAEIPALNAGCLPVPTESSIFRMATRARYAGCHPRITGSNGLTKKSITMSESMGKAKDELSTDT